MTVKGTLSSDVENSLLLFFLWEPRRMNLKSSQNICYLYCSFSAFGVGGDAKKPHMLKIVVLFSSLPRTRLVGLELNLNNSVVHSCIKNVVSLLMKPAVFYNCLSSTLNKHWGKKSRTV